MKKPSGVPGRITSRSRRDGARTARDSGRHSSCVGPTGFHASRTLGSDSDAGVVVALELDAEREVEVVGQTAISSCTNRFDQSSSRLCGMKPNRKPVVDVVARMAIAAAPEQLVLRRTACRAGTRCRRCRPRGGTSTSRRARCGRSSSAPAGRSRPRAARVQRASRFAPGVLDAPKAEPGAPRSSDCAAIGVALHREACSARGAVGAKADLAAVSTRRARPCRSRARCSRAPRLRVDAEVAALAERRRRSAPPRRARGCRRRAQRASPCVSAAARVITLITPLTAFAPHSVAPGPLMTSMRSTSSSITSCSSQNTPENSGV